MPRPLFTQLLSKFRSGSFTTPINRMNNTITQRINTRGGVEWPSELAIMADRDRLTRTENVFETLKAERHTLMRQRQNLPRKKDLSPEQRELQNSTLTSQIENKEFLMQFARQSHNNMINGVKSNEGLRAIPSMQTRLEKIAQINASDTRKYAAEKVNSSRTTPQSNATGGYGTKTKLKDTGLTHPTQRSSFRQNWSGASRSDSAVPPEGGSPSAPKPQRFHKGDDGTKSHEL